jgi:hypothetical protein
VRLRMLALVCALGVLPLGGPATRAAQRPGEPPASFTGVDYPILLDDEYAISCDRYDTAVHEAHVLFFLLTNPAGDHIYAGQGFFSSTTQPAARIRLSDTTVADEALPEVEDESSDLYSSVNGVDLTETPIDPAKAVRARLTDFTGTAAVDAGLAGAGANLEFTRTVDGFVFAWFYATGIVSNRGPGRDQSASGPGVFTGGAAQGTWRFTTTAAFQQSAPRAYLLEMPL